MKLFTQPRDHCLSLLICAYSAPRPAPTQPCPRPGPLFEGNSVGEGTTRRGTATPVHNSCGARATFLGQGWNPCPLHWRADSYPPRPQGSPPGTAEMSPAQRASLAAVCIRSLPPLMFLCPHNGRDLPRAGVPVTL